MRYSRELLAAGFALLSGCSAVWGPLYEPHVPTQPGAAVVYIYQHYDPRDPLEDTGGRVAIISGECSISVNGNAVARCTDRTYSVVEIQPGRLTIDVLLEGRSVSALSVGVEPDETYYVWAHWSPPPTRANPTANIEFALRQEQERVALQHLSGLRKQDPL